MKTLFLACILLLSSCGRIPAISGSGDASPVIEVGFYQELPQCNADYEGVLGRVISEYKYYVCRANQWTYLDLQ